MASKRQDRARRDRVQWLLVLLALALAGIHLYLGLGAPFVADADAQRFILIAGIFLVGVVVYFTSYWRPLWYLVGTLLSLYLGQLWLLGGMRYFSIGVVTGVVSTGFMFLTLYLFLREERRSTGV